MKTQGRWWMHPAWPVPVALLLAAGYCLWSGDCRLLTPDQAGYRAFQRHDFAAAAEQFADPRWRAAALYRVGQFEQAAGILSGFDSADAAFNQGNALVMLGRYDDAAQRYRRALELRPGWERAQHNLDIALSRARALQRHGGDMTGGQLGADDIEFSTGDKRARNDTQSEETVTDIPGDAALRAVWLRQVQTRPADFLRAKFAYQLASREAGED